jgi:lipopolysaccharide transport system permease protein
MTQRMVYTSDSSLRRPREFLAAMVCDLRASRELAWLLMVRDLRAQHRQSILGVAWAFLPPLALAAGLTLATRAQVIHVGDTDIPYPAFVMFSTALWQTFVEALNGPWQALTNARGILSRVNFPREAIVLAKLGEVHVNFGAKLLLIVALFLWFRIPVGWSALLAPIALIQLVLLGTLLGIVLAPFALLYQDVSKGLPVILGVWLLLTPVVYPVPTAGTFARIVGLNPVTPILVTTRELATTGVLSDPVGAVVVSGLTVVGLAVAWVLFRLAMPLVIQRLGS